MNRLVISVDSYWKNLFDGVLIISSVYNVIMNAYYASFRSPYKKHELWIENAIEGMFFFDMIFCFF
mgnify:CR=1 FL=1